MLLVNLTSNDGLYQIIEVLSMTQSKKYTLANSVTGSTENTFSETGLSDEQKQQEIYAWLNLSQDELQSDSTSTQVNLQPTDTGILTSTLDTSILCDQKSKPKRKQDDTTTLDRPGEGLKGRGRSTKNILVPNGQINSFTRIYNFSNIFILLLDFVHNSCF